MTDLSVQSGMTDPAASAAQTRLTADTQSFLKLLTTQLSNQDPLAPVDPTQFVSQLAQFSSVEQAVQSNSRLAEVLSELRASGDRMDLSYIGREVEVADTRVALTEDGASARYLVPDGAQRVEVRILDMEGKTVRTIQGSTVAGIKDLEWDGRTDSGTQAETGIYRVEIGAFDKDGKQLETQITVTDKVRRVVRQDGETLFQLNGGQVVTRDQIVSAG